MLSTWFFKQSHCSACSGIDKILFLILFPFPYCAVPVRKVNFLYPPLVLKYVHYTKKKKKSRLKCQINFIQTLIQHIGNKQIAIIIILVKGLKMSREEGKGGLKRKQNGQTRMQSQNQVGNIFIIQKKYSCLICIYHCREC